MSHLHAIVTAASLGLLASACSDAAPAELDVWISADNSLSERLAAIEVELFREGEEETAPVVAAHTFAIAQTQGHAQPLLFSFRVADQGRGGFTLVAHGCADSAACERSIIESKARVHFESRKVLRVHLHLGSACAGDQELCAGFDETCGSEEREGTPVICVAVPDATLTEVARDSLEPPSLPDEQASRVAATMTMTGDESEDELVATPMSQDPVQPQRPNEEATAGSPAAADVEEASEPPLMCPPGNPCIEPYVCLPRVDGSYTCQGQYAEWPMPDSMPGARTPPSYDTKTKSGVVIDNVTGLWWQRSLPQTYAGCTRGDSAVGQTCTWSEARDYCASLELAGASWRLPTFMEVASLIDYRNEVATLDGEIFQLTVFGPYWTSSPFASASGDESYYVWAFSTGEFGQPGSDQGYSVRCVHTEIDPAIPVPAHYTYDDRQDLILDNYTQLLWSGKSFCRRDLSYEEAEDFCAGLTQRMRVPSIKELLTLLDAMGPFAQSQQSSPFVHPDNALYWSQTESKANPGKLILWLWQRLPWLLDETQLPALRPEFDKVLRLLATPATESQADPEDAGVYAMDLDDAGVDDSASQMCVRCIK